MAAACVLDDGEQKKSFERVRAASVVTRLRWRTGRGRGMLFQRLQQPVTGQSGGPDPGLLIESTSRGSNMQNVDFVDASDAGSALTDLGDNELVMLARAGNHEAYAVLFRRHSYAAHRLARHLGQKEEAEDVVSESFARVLDLVRRGGGPATEFRAYLFTTVRHESARRAKARQRVVPTDDAEQIDRSVPFGGGQLDAFEKSAIRAAYESLPTRWRTVLWYLDVEGRKPREVGPMLDLSSNSVSVLVYRARSGLREAYLQQHLRADATVSSDVCRGMRPKLPALVRNAVTAREREKILVHLRSCHACMAVHLDLEDVNREVGAAPSPR